MERNRFAAIRVIHDITKIVAALNAAQDVLALYVTPTELKVPADEIINRLLAILDDKRLLAAMENADVPDAIKAQAQTVLKHSRPPSGANIEVSSAWFRMVQNLARYTLTGSEDIEYADFAKTVDAFISANPVLFDAGAEKRGDRSDQC